MCDTTRTPWRWDGGLASSFDEHACASIPLYDESRWLTLELSDEFAVPGTAIYDLGSSTGTLAASLADRHPGCSVIGIDSEPEMTAAASTRRANLNARFETADAASVNIAGASFVVAHHLLPFLTVAERSAVLANVAAGLIDGGALLIAEKTLPDTAAGQVRASGALTSYKLAHGLTSAEVVRKELALRGVMRPRSSDHVHTELQSAGFTETTTVLSWMNWTMILAVKGTR